MPVHYFQPIDMQKDFHSFQGLKLGRYLVYSGLENFCHTYLFAVDMVV